MMKRNLLLFLLALLVVGVELLEPGIAAAQSSNGDLPVVTLEEARRRAVATAPQGVAAQAEVDVAAWEKRSALTNLFTPTLSGSTAFTRFSDPFFNFGTGEITRNAASITAQASYTVLGGGKLAELRRSRASVDRAEANETVTRFSLALAADAAYLAVLANHELARVASDRLHRAEEQFAIARSRVLAGDAISTDSLQLLLEVNRARLAILRSDSAITVSRLRLGRQIGIPGGAEAAPLEPVTPRSLPISHDDAVREMLARGPEIEAARADERSADAAVGVVREAYLPEITLGATAGAYDSEYFPSALRRSQLNVTVSYPIWNSRQRRLGIARARARQQVAAAERAELERATAEQMAEAYHGYEMARAGIELAHTDVAVANESFSVQRSRFREGATTILDLLEAQVALTESEARLVQARYAARLALARIETLLGRRLDDTSNTD